MGVRQGEVVTFTASNWKRNGNDVLPDGEKFIPYVAEWTLLARADEKEGIYDNIIMSGDDPEKFVIDTSKLTPRSYRIYLRVVRDERRPNWWLPPEPPTSDESARLCRVGWLRVFPADSEVERLDFTLIPDRRTYTFVPQNSPITYTIEESFQPTTLEDKLTELKWYIDDILQSEHGKTLTINTSGLSLGSHVVKTERYLEVDGQTGEDAFDYDWDYEFFIVDEKGIVGTPDKTELTVKKGDIAKAYINWSINDGRGLDFNRDVTSVKLYVDDAQTSPALDSDNTEWDSDENGMFITLDTAPLAAGTYKFTQAITMPNMVGSVDVMVTVTDGEEPAPEEDPGTGELEPDPDDPDITVDPDPITPDPLPGSDERPSPVRRAKIEAPKDVEFTASNWKDKDGKPLDVDTDSFKLFARRPGESKPTQMVDIEVDVHGKFTFPADRMNGNGDEIELFVRASIRVTTPNSMTADDETVDSEHIYVVVGNGVLTGTLTVKPETPTVNNNVKVTVNLINQLESVTSEKTTWYIDEEENFDAKSAKFMDFTPDEARDYKITADVEYKGLTETLETTINVTNAGGGAGSGGKGGGGGCAAGFAGIALLIAIPMFLKRR